MSSRRGTATASGPSLGGSIFGKTSPTTVETTMRRRGSIRESLAIEREIGNHEGEAVDLGNLGLVAASRGEYDEAERLYRESLAIQREVGDRHGEGTSLGNLGLIASKRGEYDEAERLHRESPPSSRR